MLLKLIIITSVLVALALAGMAITILVKPKGRFPNTHISHNKEMKKRGITCAQHTDTGCNPVDSAACCGCSMKEG